MQPDIDVFGISLKTFGIFFALNFIAWGLVAGRRLKAVGRRTSGRTRWCSSPSPAG